MDMSGKLARNAVLKAICAGFEETTEPSLCLTPGQCPFILNAGHSDFPVSGFGLFLKVC